MSVDLIVECPINSLSLGQVSLNLLREMWLKDMAISLFPIQEQTDIRAYDKLDEKFVKWLDDSINERYKRLNKNTPSFKLWHIHGSESQIGDNTTVFTFHECSQVTEAECRIASLPDIFFVSSTYSSEIFQEAGVNAKPLSLGFDKDLEQLDKDYLGPDVIHFGLIGKWEKRKNTEQIIRLWNQQYGNNPKYRLTCLVNNPFIDQSEIEKRKFNIFSGKTPRNITFMPHLGQNSQVNDLMCAIDIDLSGLSNAEGWNLPAFNCTALGKWSCVTNFSSHKDWATDDNCILVEPDGEQDIYDNVFFKYGMPFNQGKMAKLEDETILSAFSDAEDKAKTENKNGVQLQSEFTYSSTLDRILKNVVHV